jgi:ribosomal protein S18 acetylase RimI-like enzyme
MSIFKKDQQIIISDDWLSKIIRKPVYHLKQFSTSLKSEDLPKNEMFIWSKIPVDDIEKLICLQKLGFYLVETNIEFSLTRQMNPKKILNVRFAKSSDEFAVRSIAKSAFKYNRFNRDQNISDKIASKIKEEWAGNFFSGKRGKWMLVAEINFKTVGFLQVTECNNDTTIIDLIAVDEKNRGKGLAKEMIYFLYLNCLKKNGIIKVGTQISNTSSIELYLNIGFRIKSASYVLHMHQ